MKFDPCTPNFYKFAEGKGRDPETQDYLSKLEKSHTQTQTLRHNTYFVRLLERTPK